MDAQLWVTPLSERVECGWARDLAALFLHICLHLTSHSWTPCRLLPLNLRYQSIVVEKHLHRKLAAPFTFCCVPLGARHLSVYYTTLLHPLKPPGEASSRAPAIPAGTQCTRAVLDL